MSMSRASWFVVVSCFGLLLSAREGAHAGERPPKPNRPAAKREAAPATSLHNVPFAVCATESTAAAKVRAALEMPTIIEFVETPLQDVVDYLKDYHKIEIQLDKKALDDSGVGTDTPITRNLRGITLKSALALMLRELDLTWVIDHEVLMITTRDGQRHEVCVYNVASLIRDSSAEKLAEVVWRSTTLPSERTAKDTSGGGTAGPLTPRGRGDDNGLTTHDGREVVPYGDLLLVRETQEGHRRISELLHQMHKALQTSR